MRPLNQTFALLGRGIGDFIHKRPFCISFEITYSCNANCKHCHRGGTIEGEELAPPETFLQIAQELKPLVVQISGGEPLVRPDMEKIVRKIKNKNGTPVIIVTTNAGLLTREKYDSLVEAGVDEYSVSLDYPDSRHNEYRGIPNLFENIVKLLESLKNEKHKRITFACVIQRDNFRDMLKMAELAKKWGVRVSFSTYTWLRTENKDYMIPKNEIPELKEMIEKTLDFKKKNNTVFTTEYHFSKMVEFFENESIPGCRAGTSMCIVNPQGKFGPCGLLPDAYDSHKDLIEKFTKNNTCSYCATISRINTEKPVHLHVQDVFRNLFKF